MSFKREFNDLLNEILTNYRNMGPTEQIDASRLKIEHPEIYSQYVIESYPDTSVGSILFLRAACTASMLWGLYSTIDKVSAQMFVETAMRRYKELHAAEYGITTAGKSDNQIVEEVLAKKRSKVAGGNRYDYEAWAKEVVSNLSNFTPPATALSQNGVGGFAAFAAVDGLTDTKAWDTNSSNSGAFVRLNLGTLSRAYTVVQMYMSSGGSNSSYSVQHSDNGIDWSTVAQITPNVDGWNAVQWASAGPHSFWRLLLTNTPGTGPYVTDMKWLEGPEGVQHVTVYPLAQGEGTFDLVILGTLELGAPSQDLLSKVYEYVNDRRPVGAGFSWGMRVLGPQLVF